MQGTRHDQLVLMDIVPKAIAAAVMDPQNQTALYRPVSTLLWRG